MVKILELKKIGTSPIVWALFLLFLAFNMFLISQHVPMRDWINILSPIVDEHGTLLDKEGREKLQLSYEKDLENWNKLLESKTSETLEHAYEFFSPEHYNNVLDENTYSDKELLTINRIMEKENYLFTAADIEEKYDNIDLMEGAEEQIRLFGLEGQAAEIVKDQYRSLEVRLENIKENKEHMHLFIHGKVYSSHSLLFKTLFGFIIFQVMILVVLCTSFLVNDEFEQRTEFVTYSTKRGRKLIWDKLIVSIIFTLCAILALLGITLGVYFLVFDYSGLWNVPISTGFLIEPNNIPFISWWELSFFEYLLLSSGLFVGCQLIFCLISFCLSIWVKNSYVVFTLFGLILGAGILLPGYMPRDGWMIFYSNFTPFTLILGVKKWWMESGAFTSFKYYEITTVSAWLTALTLTSWLCTRFFYRQNL